MEKTCSDCGAIKPTSEFHKTFVNQAGEQRYARCCKECAKARASKWYQKNIEYARESGKRKQRERRNLGIDVQTRRKRDWKNKYGLSVEDWQALFDAQQGACSICSIGLGGKKICVDHCHKTNKVRGLLCSRCNQGLGYFSDDPDVLTRAAEYVRG